MTIQVCTEKAHLSHALLCIIMQKIQELIMQVSQQNCLIISYNVIDGFSPAILYIQ